MKDKSEPLSLWRKAEIAIYTLLGVAMTLLMFGNAVLRYLFDSSIVWSEEVIRIFFVFAMFVAITGGFIRNEHIGFDNIARIPGACRLIHRLVTNLGLLVVGGLLAFHGGRFTLMTGDVPLPATNLPTYLFMWPGVAAGVAWSALGAWRLIALLGRREPA
jgi:TRAP-type C4-dicarboxylate transport system permease small subunit